MQVCLNGHQITDSYNRSHTSRKDFCDKCGEKTIVFCPNCNEKVPLKIAVDLLSALRPAKLYQHPDSTVPKIGSLLYILTTNSNRDEIGE